MYLNFMHVNRTTHSFSAAIPRIEVGKNIISTAEIATEKTNSQHTRILHVKTILKEQFEKQI